MARSRIGRPGRGGFKDSTKEMLVISYLLSQDNVQSSATQIWNAWNPKNPDAVGAVASDKDRTLSLAGTIKICSKLSGEGVLVSIKQIGYNDRSIMFYRFPSEEDPSYRDGFLRVAERTKNAPFLLMESAYGKGGIRAVLMNKVEKDLGTDLGPWRALVEWAAERSPTAFMMICDRELSSEGSDGSSGRALKLQSFLRAMRGAMSVDRMSSHRGRLLNKDKHLDEVEELLEVGATSAGKENKALLERLQKFEEA